jgi:hypothetical protein
VAADQQIPCSAGPPTVSDTTFSPPTNSLSPATMSSFWPYQQKLALPTGREKPLRFGNLTTATIRLCVLFVEKLTGLAPF